MSKLLSGTSKTKAGALFWKSHCAACSPACVILYHVAGSSKGPIGVEGNSVREITWLSQSTEVRPRCGPRWITPSLICRILYILLNLIQLLLIIAVHFSVASRSSLTARNILAFSQLLLVRPWLLEIFWYWKQKMRSMSGEGCENQFEITLTKSGPRYTNRLL